MGLPLKTGADPGYLVGGGANIQFLPDFPQNLHEIKKILVRGGGLGSATEKY